MSDRAPVDLNELERYLRIFQENPDSRVFAPLADLYRRLGRLKDAEEICREGIQRHPYYAGGRVALAHILLDSNRLPEALLEIESVVTYYPDNLLARKILIRTLGGLGSLERARREFEALKGLAPLVAGDPDLEAALQGPSARPPLPPSPGPRDSPFGGPAPSGIREGILHPIELHEKTEWQTERESSPAPAPSPDPAVLRSRRLQALARKRMIVESLLKALENPMI